ncbi:MAG TPA: methyltransferase domain-containing protein [Bacillota bacterium]|nr:methyltransferase domain-containing protein [Bacillota bacterium]
MEQNFKIQKRYDRIAKYYDFFEGLMEKGAMEQWRKIVWEQAQGQVLEVGVGTGRNIPYYPEHCQVTAIDFSTKMLEKAKEKTTMFHKRVDLQQMDVQSLQFPDHTFDTVISTCVFCSVPDPVKGLQEIQRVCKLQGQIIMLEHVRSQKPLLGWLMDLLNPLAVRMIGDNINRDTIKNLRNAGIKVVHEQNLASDIVKLLKCSS